MSRTAFLRLSATAGVVIAAVVAIYLSLHYLFVAGCALFALCLWASRTAANGERRYLIPANLLFVVAALAFVMGVLEVSKAYRARPDSWQAQARMRFSGWTMERAKGETQGDRKYHHTIVAPDTHAMRLPAAFDTLTHAADVSVRFDLLPDGGIGAVTTAHSSGDSTLDAAVERTVKSWRFGALPPTVESPAQETVTVRFYNNYLIYGLTRKIVGFVFLYIALWWTALQLCPTRRQEEVVHTLLQRLIVAVGFLGGISWILMYRLGPDKGRIDLIEKQMGFVLAGMALLTVLPAFMRVRRSWVSRRKTSVVEETVGPIPRGIGWAAFGVLLLIYTAVHGVSVNTEAKLWISLGPLGTFQTIEIVKLFYVGFVAMAAYGMTRSLQRVSSKGASPGTGSVFLIRTSWQKVNSLILAFGIVLLCLFLMKDIGPAFLLFTFLTIFFALMRQRAISRTALVLLLSASLLGYGIGSLTHRISPDAKVATKMTKAFTDTYERSRQWISTWTVLPGENPDGHEQMADAQWALSSGGLWGRGLGYGMAEKIPVVESDFIFASLAEETGWMGCTALLAVIAFIVVGLLQSAVMARSAYDKILLSGVGIMIGLQSLLILAGNLRLMPLSGVTLPFIGYGGSSMVCNFLAIGLALGVMALRSTHDTESFDSREAQALDGGLCRKAIPLFTGAFLLCSLLLGWRQVPWGSEYQNQLTLDNGIVRQNPRLTDVSAAQHVTRGSITTADGVVLDGYARARGPVYELTPSLAFVRTDVEARLGETLRGKPQGRVTFAGDNRTQGFDVVMTIDSRLQRSAERLLAAHESTGSIVGIDPETGKILFAASRSAEPSNRESAWRQQAYAPGSTFKTIVMTAGMENGTLSSATTLLCPPTDLGIGEFHPEGTETLNATEALARSRNTFFTQAARKVGWESLFHFTTQKLQFGTFLPLLPDDFRSAQQTTWLYAEKSVLSPGQRDPDSVSAKALALSGIGQQDVRMTPLHMALWAGTVANGGKFMTPTLVQSIQDSKGKSLWEWTPKMAASTAIAPGAIQELRPMMRAVVASPSGTAFHAFSRCPFAAAGKTGTAQAIRSGENQIDGLFIAFAPYDHPRIAIAVVVENIGEKASGGVVAAPIARKMLEEALQASPARLTATPAPVR